jgi:broad specificity phosphatase PhoE
MFEALLIRHGESEANCRNILVSHRGDPLLTAKGHEEANIIAGVWREKQIVALFASPLQRTQQTAQAFVRPGIEVQTDARLHEIALGRWDGLTIHDIETQDGERYRQWKLNPELGAPDAGEPLSYVSQRIYAFLDDVKSRYVSGLVVAVTHSDCLKAVALAALDAPWHAAQWIHMMNTAGIYLQWRDDHWQMMEYPVMPLNLPALKGGDSGGTTVAASRVVRPWE